MKAKKKPYDYWPSIGDKKPFKLEIDFKQGAVVKGLHDSNIRRSFRFTKPIPVKKGDSWLAVPGKGILLNGTLVERKILPPKSYAIKMGWAPEKLKLAVFLDRDRMWSKKLKRFTKKFHDTYWCAMDLRGYWIGTGKTPQTAIQSLIFSLQATDDLQKEEEKLGRKVIRWHCERKERKYLAGIEKQARKNGFILDGVEWRTAFFAKKLAVK